MKKGIAIGGHISVDIIHFIEKFPAPGELCSITKTGDISTGGLACLAPEIPLYVYGVVGDDDKGDFVYNKFLQYPSIDASRLVRDSEIETGFTLVMNDVGTMQRTFFHHRGGNSRFCENSINIENLDIELFHIGYILLLDMMDEKDEHFGTRMARVLQGLKKRGIKTSVDLITESSDRVKHTAIPALKYTDYCIINEAEAQAITGVVLSDNNKIIEGNMPTALHRLKEYGVTSRVVIHCPEGSWGLDEQNNLVTDKSIKLPKGFKKGSVGAGDAFCAGVLLGTYNDMPLKDALVLGQASAICALSQPGSTEGMRSREETMLLFNKLKAEAENNGD